MSSRRWVVLVLVGCAGRSSIERPESGAGPANVVPASARALEACADAPVLTLDELAAGHGTGERIAFDAVPVVERACTLLDCGGRACCNSCRGEYVVRHPAAAAGTSPALVIRLDGLAGCRGTECGVRCEPFGTAPTARYRFVGTHRRFAAPGTEAAFAQAYVQVDRYCRQGVTGTSGP